MASMKKHPARVVPQKTNLYLVEFWPWTDSEGNLHETDPIRVFEPNVDRAAINAAYSQMRRYMNIGIKQITNMNTGEVFKGKLTFVERKD